MVIEIRNAGFTNKGAHLMLLAVIDKITERFPAAKLTMVPSDPSGDQSFEDFAKLGIFPKVSLTKWGVPFGDAIALLPKKLRDRYGLVADYEVDVVLDASGFAYSDQWGIYPCRELARSSRRWSRRGTKLILLPQALGPFNDRAIQKFVKEWVRNARLIFSREQDSFDYLTRIVGTSDNVSMRPDFTNLLAGTLPDSFEQTDNLVALVPNYRMVDKTDLATSNAYIPFMVDCAVYLQKKGMRPFILVHEGEKDENLAHEIAKRCPSLSIVRERSPLHIKGILGSCVATVGSRYHGLISALSQGVPSLATAWSHKYERLFEEYGFEQGIISVTASVDEINSQLDLIIDAESRKNIQATLVERSMHLKDSVESMWQSIFDVIEN
jgi:polysaccharide pyruvyl transferase WcaK-like protein